ncbi:MAG: tetratricopeptide repeat protein [Gemmatimonadota bacterium]
MTPGQGDRPAAAAVQSGTVPPLAASFVPRPDTGVDPASGLAPGRLLALTAPPQLAPDWPGGTGKTQLAAHLARTWWQAGELDLLVWVTASSRASVLAGYVQALADRTGTVPAGDAETAAARFLSLLAGTSERWLVVLDDVTGPADLTGLWPAGPAGRVVVTALSEAMVQGAPDPQVFPVEVFSPHEALEYLRGRLSAYPDQRMGAVDLVHDLGCEPLALLQASATIAGSGLTCRDYRDLFAQRQEQLARTLGAQPSAKSVTWTLAAERAESLSPGGLPQACLTLAAFLGCDGIPGAVFSAPAAAGFIAGPAAAAADPARAREALASLERTGLLTIDTASPARTVRLHGSVQAAVMAAAPGPVRGQAARAAAHAVLQAWPEDGGQPEMAAALRSCVVTLQAAAGGALWADKAHTVLFRAAQSLDNAGLPALAVSQWQELASASERALGPAHPDTLLAADGVASATLAAGLVTDAARYYQRALEARAALVGPDHPSTVTVRADLGRALLAAGRPGDAIAALDEALAAGQRGQSDMRDLLAVQDSLVAAHLAAGDYPRAVRLATRTLAERERRQGPDHPDTMATRRSLARACLAAGKLKDAITHGQRALAGYERVLGPSHLDTIDAVSDLASAHHSARRLKDAIPLYERALAGRERQQGPDHPDTIGARGNLASAYHSAGRMASALELYERTRADCQRVLGADHPDTLAARANLAHAYYATGRQAEAARLLRSALTDCERVLAPGDPLTAAVRDSLDAVVRS